MIGPRKTFTALLVAFQLTACGGSAPRRQTVCAATASACDLIRAYCSQEIP